MFSTVVSVPVTKTLAGWMPPATSCLARSGRDCSQIMSLDKVLMERTGMILRAKLNLIPDGIDLVLDRS